MHPKAVPLHDVLGCATSVPLDAPEDVPPFRNTAMDGYAVRAADTFGASAATPVRLEVAGLLAAGAAPTIEVAAGHAVRIMTGAAMPAGADAVVMVEETEAGDDDTVLVRLQVAPGDARASRRASDVSQATECSSRDGARPGAPRRARVARLRARAGVPAGSGRRDVDRRRARRRRRTARARADPRLEPRTMLLALVEQAGCEPVDLGLVRDDEDAIAAAFDRGAARLRRADLIAAA